jgi:SAM-dependent methyltransferase
MGDATPVFGTYATYYDTLYQNKDYEAECDFVERMLGQHAQGPVKSILDMGCGTGGHAIPLIHIGDVRDLDLGQTFDAVIFMFAVIAYQTTNAGLNGALRSARRHLEPGGLVLFDTWYGPGVLADPPTDRIRETEDPDDGSRIVRITQPAHDRLAQTIEVRFRVLHLQGERLVGEVRESHLLRYLFPQELDFHLEQAGFRLRKLCPFMHPDAEISRAHWNVAVVAEAV